MEEVLFGFCVSFSLGGGRGGNIGLSNRDIVYALFVLSTEVVRIRVSRIFGAIDGGGLAVSLFLFWACGYLFLDAGRHLIFPRSIREQ